MDLIQNENTSFFYKNIIRVFKLWFLEAVFYSKFEDYTDSFIIKIYANEKFINITLFNEEEFSKNFCFLKLNLDRKFYRNLINKLVNKKDRLKSIVAGGCFSKYTLNDISVNFEKIFNLIVQKGDVDIYIETSNYKIYEDLFSTKIINHYKFGNSNLSSMKIRKFGLNINLIFPNVKKGIDNMKIIEEFDFKFSKIFYSYRDHSIYAPIVLLDRFHERYYDFHLDGFYRYRKTLMDNKRCYQNFGTILPYFFAVNFGKKFLRYDVFRFVKYVFKGFYKNSEEKELISLIKFYSESLEKHLLNDLK